MALHETALNELFDDLKEVAKTSSKRDCNRDGENETIELLVEEYNKKTKEVRFLNTAFLSESVVTFVFDCLVVLYKRKELGLLDPVAFQAEGKKLRTGFIEKMKSAEQAELIMRNDQQRFKDGSQALTEFLEACDKASRPKLIELAVEMIKNYFNEPAGKIAEKKLIERKILKCSKKA